MVRYFYRNQYLFHSEIIINNKILLFNNIDTSSAYDWRIEIFTTSDIFHFLRFKMT
jgi:hypothetical protein